MASHRIGDGLVDMALELARETILRTPDRHDDAIKIVAAVVLDARGRLLLVRKRGSESFMQPGGKLEPRETPIEALQRELAEELGGRFDPDAAVFLGRFHAPAANEPGLWVDALLFEIVLEGPIAIAAEIEEFAWVDPRETESVKLAPLTRDTIVPLVASRRVR
jgi:8-oxo-dGTP diphosphatase